MSVGGTKQQTGSVPQAMQDRARRIVLRQYTDDLARQGQNPGAAGARQGKRVFVAATERSAKNAAQTVAKAASETVQKNWYATRQKKIAEREDREKSEQEHVLATIKDKMANIKVESEAWG
jgi:hypothetical protein